MKPTTIGRFLAIVGAICQLGPFVGMVGSVIGMIQVFNSVGSRGVGGPSVLDEGMAGLSNTVGNMMIITVIGFIMALIGLVLFTVSLVACNYRAEWFFWLLMITGALALMMFPIGTAFGIFFLVYCLTKRHEFLRPASDAAQLPPPQP